MNISDHLKPADVPVFNCIVYVSHGASGVRARVANLGGLNCAAATEREALSKIVGTFKDTVKKLVQSESPIPWIDPPTAIEVGEQERLIPIHL